MTDKRQKATKVKCKREESLAKQSIFWNIIFSRRSIWVLLELVGRWTQQYTLPKSTRRHVKLDKFIFGTPWLPDLLCKRWFASSVWNFCRWVADVPLRGMSPVGKSEEKRMFSQAMTIQTRNPDCHHYFGFICWVHLDLDSFLWN